MILPRVDLFNIISLKITSQESSLRVFTKTSPSFIEFECGRLLIITIIRKTPANTLLSPAREKSLQKNFFRYRKYLIVIELLVVTTYILNFIHAMIHNNILRHYNLFLRENINLILRNISTLSNS